MTNEDDPQPETDELKRVDLVLAPPRAYRWASKLLLIVTGVLLSVAVVLLVPNNWRLSSSTQRLSVTVHDLSSTVHDLARANAVEKAQDACYDQYSADVTDGNARTLAASVDSAAAIGALVVSLARGQRDPVFVDPLINRIELTSQRAADASTSYNAAIAARKDYVAAGRPLPCINLPN